MHRTTVVLAHLLFALALFAAPSLAGDDETLKKDLTAVIALQGLPCGEVVNVVVQAESDFAVTCRDANKYHVYVNGAGRVVVDKK
jgi:hypothetical protein